MQCLGIDRGTRRAGLVCVDDHGIFREEQMGRWCAAHSFRRQMFELPHWPICSRTETAVCQLR